MLTRKKGRAALFLTLILLAALALSACAAKPETAEQAAPQSASDPLPSWNEGSTKDRILKFVADVTDAAGASYVPPADRIAVFDNDGTLWTEKPVPVQAAFAVARVAQMAPDHPEWQTTQPYQAILEKDLEMLQSLGLEGVEELVLGTHAGMTEEEFESIAGSFLATARHPRFDVLYTETVYQPMLELLAFLRANGFRTFIVSGGGVEFMRVFSEEVYGIPRENVIGSSLQYEFQTTPDGGVLIRQPELVSFDNEAMKPASIQLHIGRRPIVAVGNSDGDLEMLQYARAGQRPFLALLLHHDDAEREYDYLTGAEEVMAAAAQSQWLVVSMQRDFATLFPYEAGD
ncbi:MAG: haloacid dehalogenase-like hydrolase [Phycisphaerales bacterium]|nr:MAG: haloacid dehalogenase-like hydrolase [Phycisphaerales bacterium]